jgi:hypothetical protein
MGSGSSTQNPQLNVVSFSETFNLYYTSRFSQKTLDKIDDFIEHFEKYNLFGDALKGHPAWIGKVSHLGTCLTVTKTKKLLKNMPGLINCGMPI